jgi:hypothetical protein
MAYATISTYSSGSVPTAAQLNQMRDNFLSLKRWNSYGVHLRLNDDITISNATLTAITWDRVEHQTGDMWNAGVNPDRITAKVSGLYAVIAMVEWHTGAGGERTMGLEKNGSTRFDLCSQTSGAGGGAEGGMELLHLAPNDYIRVMVYHAFGSSLDLRGSAKDRTNVFMWLASNP